MPRRRRAHGLHAVVEHHRSARSGRDDRRAAGREGRASGRARAARGGDTPAAAEPPATTATTAPEAPAPAAIEPTEAPKPAPTGDAKEEKAACKSALERGKVADAIEAGERAVALDETDAEAWLLLGAAYQEKGKLADARRAYTSCVKLGVKGKHTTECAQMLR